MKKTILICLFLLFLTSGCTRKYNMPLHQTLEDVQKIELVDTSDNKDTVLHTLVGNEAALFWRELSELHVGQYFNDPATEFGSYAVRIFYNNGYVDVIGMDICLYIDPNGSYDIGDEWYYIADDDTFVELLSRYIPE